MNNGFNSVTRHHLPSSSGLCEVHGDNGDGYNSASTDGGNNDGQSIILPTQA